MVPEGWAEKALDEVCSSPISYGVVKPGDERSGGVPFIRGGDFPNGQINKSGLRTISESISKTYKRTILKGGEVLISLVGYPGATTIVPPELAGANIARQAALVRPKGSVNTHYLYQFLTSAIGQKRMLSQTIGSAQQVINLKDLRAVSVLLPPLPEQQKIAEILSTWDKAIETTEALLANARTQKRALMQSLLTGTRRFPGFEDHPWREVRLGDAARIITGSTPATNTSEYYGGSIPFVSPADLHGQKNLTKTVKTLTEAGADVSRLVPKDSILFSCIGHIGKMAKTGRDVVTNQQINSVVPNRNVNADFLFYALQDRAPKIGLLAGHNVIPIINKSEFSLTNICLPNLDEQRRISQVLNCEDAFIEGVSLQLANLRTEKKSLMQQLLTGKRRVVV